MILEQLTLVCIERFVLPVHVAPPIRKPSRDFSGEKSAEQCVTRVRSRFGKNSEVMSRLSFEERRKQWLEHAPLIESQTIDDDENCGPIALKNRQKEFADHVDRKRRPISLEILEPCGVI